MPRKTLQHALDELHHQLENTDDIAPPDRAALERVRDELDLLLEPEAEDPENLAEQVDDAVTRFEVEHPKLTEIMNRIAHALAGMGI